ncbi:MAG: acyltransferase family protein [Chloroflexota bacterium]
MQPGQPAVQRRFDLDWLRVIAILMVFVFHSTRFFDKFDWHVKNPSTYQGVQLWTTFFSTWGMPLMFVISGASLYFSVGRPGKFAKDKALRLLVPLVVGVFTHVALGVYLERLTHYQFSGSFFAFYPRYFQGLYGEGGNFAWMGLHLWYLLVLFVYSLLFLPVFYLLKGPWKKALLWLGDLFSRPGLVYLLAIPVMWIAAGINPYSALGQRNWGGWSLLGYVPFLFYGFLLIAHEGLQERVKAWRWVSLGLALACTVALAYTNDSYPGAAFGSRGYTIVNALFGLHAWLYVLAIFGFGIQYLNFANRFLAYANEAVLPFYILHQTSLLCIGYYVTRWAIPDLAKYVIISASAFLLTLAIYEYLIRRNNLLRVLFGMKPRPRLTAASPTAASQPA